MVHCTKCGVKNDEDAAFCKKCGAQFKPPEPKAEATQPPVRPPTTAGQPPTAGPPPTVHRPPHRHMSSYDHEREWDDRCEEECTGGSGRYSWIWGALIILLGIWVALELGIKNIPGIPEEIKDFDFWWVLPLLFGILLVMAGLDAMSRIGCYRQ